MNIQQQWIQVASAADFPEDMGGCVKVADKQIAIFNLHNKTQWYGIDNVCPHENLAVLSRGICGDSQGQPKVACPMHKRTFALDSGKCLSDEELPEVQTYEVKCEDGDIYHRWEGSLETEN